MLELEEVLTREKLVIRYGITSEEREDLLLLIDAKAIFAQPQRRLPVVIRDPKDSIVLATALGGSADYLITGDKDLLDLRDDPRVGSLQILTVGEFLQLLPETE